MNPHKKINIFQNGNSPEMGKSCELKASFRRKWCLASQCEGKQHSEWLLGKQSEAGR